ncbi:MAG: methyltransferase [Pseudomonadota bacterium]
MPTSISWREQDLTRDAFLGGRLQLWQPKSGHRIGHDGMLLAAACDASPGDSVSDFGAGNGGAGIAIASRLPDIDLTLVDIEPSLLDLARLNLEDANVRSAKVIECDLTASAKDREATGLLPNVADHIVLNPPFYTEGTVRPSLDLIKRRSHVSSPDTLERWLKAAAHHVKANGTLTLIHRAEALVDVLNAAKGRFGNLAILPLQPYRGAPAHRIIVAGRAGSKERLRLLPPLALHETKGGEQTEAVAALLRDGEALPLVV